MSNLSNLDSTKTYLEYALSMIELNGVPGMTSYQVYDLEILMRSAIRNIERKKTMLKSLENEQINETASQVDETENDQ